MKKNSKGFTLVELLAVIVVLAVIMVIATTQINGIIKKNRVDAFVSTYKVVLNSVKTCAVQNLTGNNCKGTVDISANDYDLTITDNADGSYGIVLSAKTGGQFGKIKIKDYFADSNALKKELGNPAGVAIADAGIVDYSDSTLPSITSTYTPQ